MASMLYEWELEQEPTWYMFPQNNVPFPIRKAKWVLIRE